MERKNIYKPVVIGIETLCCHKENLLVMGTTKHRSLPTIPWAQMFHKYIIMEIDYMPIFQTYRKNTKNSNIYRH